METQNIEYKPSWRDEYLKVIVAFANKDGGELIVGVDDNGNPIECQEQGLPEPDFEEDYGVMKVVFYKDKFTEENLKKLGISERQIKAVMYVKEKKSINLSSFKTIVFEVSKKTLYRDLQELVSKGILKELGEKKGRKYELL